MEVNTIDVVGGFVEGAAVQIQFLRCSVVNCEEEGTGATGGGVDLQLVNSVRRNLDIRERDGVSCSSDVAGFRKPRRVIAETTRDRAAESGHFRLIRDRNGLNAVSVSTDDDSVKVWWIADRITELDEVIALLKTNRNNRAGWKNEAASARVKRVVVASIDGVEIRAQALCHGIDLHVVDTRAVNVNVVESNGVSQTQPQVANLSSARARSAGAHTRRASECSRFGFIAG